LTREPLLHFLVAGLALYTAGRTYERWHDSHRIEVTAARVAQLAEAYRKQYGEAPGAAMRESLIHTDIDNEILYREGVRLNLGQDDEVVRRRIIQKMQFLAQNLGAPAEPADDQIEAYYRAHAEHYVQPITVSFTHIYYSRDLEGSVNAETRARAALARLGSSNRSRAPELGDSFPDRYDFAGVESKQIQRLFGRTPFSAAVLTAPVGRWSGPFLSGYGWHLLRVSVRSAAAQTPLMQVRDQVRSDLLAETQDQHNRTDFQALRRRFTIVRSDGAR
jgi:peptidyl-prolyl cis-trans isomerase C